MSTSDRLVAGLVGDRYEITGLIASGGMGSVYRAYDTILERRVALKVLKQNADPSFVSRFRSEATNAARLSHPAIVQVYDFGYAEDVPYIAMEYVDGQTLRDVLVGKTVLSPESAAHIAIQVAGALEHARRAGIVHRDIKPENILITLDGQVKVADFGLSRAFAESGATMTGTVLGTVHYLAPEQVQGRAVDHRADVYALGVVLYEMLTGRPPFGGDSPQAIAYRRIGEDVPSATATNPSVPRELDAVMMRATARDPNDRYSTAAEMAEALRALPRSNTGDLGALVHHTEAVPINAEHTVALKDKRPRAARVRHRRRRILVALLALATIATTSVLVADRFRTVEVPSVAGDSQEEAKAALVAKGFEVDVVLRNDPDVASGLVITQDPAAGVAVRSGSTIELVVSIGPLLVSVPDVRSMDSEAAEALLRDKGFDVVRVDVFHDTVARRKVVSQSPESGLLVEKGQTVTIRVSKGAELVRVPNVVGDPEQQAVADIERAGFEVSITRQRSDTVKAGMVISQSPTGGARAQKGATVKLVISQGPPPVKVPNLRCMTRRQAEDALAHAGFKAQFQDSGSRVVDQVPGPDETAPRGSTITVYMGYGSFC